MKTNPDGETQDKIKGLRTLEEKVVSDIRCSVGARERAALH